MPLVHTLPSSFSNIVLKEPAANATTPAGVAFQKLTFEGITISYAGAKCVF